MTDVPNDAHRWQPFERRPHPPVPAPVARGSAALGANERALPRHEGALERMLLTRLPTLPGRRLDFGHQLADGEQHERGVVHPRQQNHDGANGAIRGVERVELLNVQPKQQRRRDPEHRRDQRADDEYSLIVMVAIRQQVVDQPEHRDERTDRERVLHDHPDERGDRLESEAGADPGDHAFAVDQNHRRRDDDDTGEEEHA